VDKPLKSVTHGQRDARPTVTFPVAGHRCPSTAIKLYCLLTEEPVWTTCPRSLPDSGSAGSWTRDLSRRNSTP